MNKQTLNIAVDAGFGKAYQTFLEKQYILNIHTFKNILEAYKSGSSIPRIDLLVFTGGADVNTELYGEEQGKYTHISKERDLIEKEMFDVFYHVPKIGVCRGSQLLTVLSGGKLIQNVSGHANGNHDISFSAGTGYSNAAITSTHHQMMYPFSMRSSDYKIIAYSTYLLSNTYTDGKDEERDLPTKFVEPEIVHYPGTNSLAIQGHPEMSGCPSGTVRICLQLIGTYLINNKRR